MALSEIPPPPSPSDTRPWGEPCPHDGTPVRWGTVPCPDGRGGGCLVLHYGWQCPTCWRVYETTE